MEYLTKAWLLWDLINNDQPDIHLLDNSVSLFLPEGIMIIMSDLYRVIITPYHLIYYRGDLVYVIGQDQQVLTPFRMSTHLLPLTNQMIIGSDNSFHVSIFPRPFVPFLSSTVVIPDSRYPVPLIFGENSIICDIDDNLRQQIYFDHHGEVFLELEVDDDGDQYLFTLKPSSPWSYLITLTSDISEDLPRKCQFEYYNGYLTVVTFFEDSPLGQEQYGIELTNDFTHFQYEVAGRPPVYYPYEEIVNDLSTIQGIIDLAYRLVET